MVPPEFAGKKLNLQARLLWRKFDRKFTEFAYQVKPDGFKRFDQVPELPVTEIAQDDVTLHVTSNYPSKMTNGAAPKAPAWMRFNDYGIGLLLEGDTRGAAIAFREVAKLRTDSVEGPLNLAKTAVQDGNLNKAFRHLRKCEEIRPGDPRVAWVWGVTLQEAGEYEKAALAYKRVLEQFPEDRATWRNLGRTYYLDRHYEKSLHAFARVLDIDPEDRVAHYHRMLCYLALGRDQQAQLAEEAYETYQIDESAQEITRAYRLNNPEANLMTQNIRTHKLKWDAGK